MAKKKTTLKRAQEIVKPGEFYEDCSFHPCLCIYSHGEVIQGISLVDGSYPRGCDANHCGVIKLSFRQAMERKFYGPPTAEDVKRIPPEDQWWDKNVSALNPRYWPLPRRLRTPTVLEPGQAYTYADDFAVNMRRRIPIQPPSKSKKEK